MTVAEKIVRAVLEQPGLTERQLADRLFGENAAIQRVNPTCRKLAEQGLLVRQGKGMERRSVQVSPGEARA